MRISEKTLILFFIAMMIFIEGCSNSTEEASAAANKLDPAVVLDFTLTQDGTYSITKKSGATIEGELTIPPKWKDKPITTIGDNAFLRCIKLTNITLPASLTSIGVTLRAK